MSQSRPLIGLCADVDVKRNHREVACLYPAYYEAIEAAGGLPVVVPPLADAVTRRALLCRLDGVLFTGGDDYDPRAFGGARHATYGPLFPRRERFDLAFVKEVLAADLPCLGICGGFQLLNLALGGTLVQDLPDERPLAAMHAATPPEACLHAVTVEPGTLLNPGSTPCTATVRSQHHQAIDRLGAGLRVTATAPDGIIEAFERVGASCCHAVQWHPEVSLPNGPDAAFHAATFRAFVSACRRSPRVQT